jgi:hypothetical protein
MEEVHTQPVQVQVEVEVLSQWVALLDPTLEDTGALHMY